MHPDWSYEAERLDLVKQVIQEHLFERTNKNSEYTNEMRNINKEMWEETGAFNGHDSIDRIPTFLQDMNLLKRNIISRDQNIKEIGMLERQIVSPYFGRVDFKENGFDTENIYIGIYGLRKTGDVKILIYDWRAPISSIFYDYEPGRAVYECPYGEIEGELLLKRQYRIDNGKLLYFFDSTVAIEDDILQDILAGSADSRMKTIVSTIQREQNRAIRFSKNRILSVQGAAGSGKTSVALHRAAYLLYRDRKDIKAENIKLFTPSGIFAKYISNVLPELGEDDIPSGTLTELAADTLGNSFEKYETYTEMMEWQLEQKSYDDESFRQESVKFKSGNSFSEILSKYVEMFEREIIAFEDIKAVDVVFMTKEEIEDLFRNSFRYMGISQRLSRIKLGVMTKINEFMAARKLQKANEIEKLPEFFDSHEIKAMSSVRVLKEMEETLAKVERMFSLDITVIYRNLFKDTRILKKFKNELSEKSIWLTVEALDNKVLLYEDQASILYLMHLLGMLKPDNEIKHIIIDEAQDYSSTAYMLFSGLYPNSGITLLGDMNQNINPSGGIGDLKEAGKILDPINSEYIELNKCYRSTIEIMEFASKILPVNGEPFGRHGSIPEVKISDDKGELYKFVNDSIKSSLHDGMSTIAVICRTLGVCHQIYNNLEKDIHASLIANGDDEPEKGVIVLPSYLSKGLEFDSVIAVITKDGIYHTDEKQLFYTVCTRALHRLDICTCKSKVD